MKKQNGFTDWMTVMIAIAIIGIVAAIAVPVITGQAGSGGGFICQGGYEFTYQGQQIIGENGGGVRCQ